MKVWIDQDLCTGDGLCEEIAPDVFVGLDDGLFYVKEGDKIFSEENGNVGGAEGLAVVPKGQEEAVVELINELIDILIQNIETGNFILKNVGSFRLISKKERIGIVVSDKADKTIVVSVQTRYAHPKYGKILLKTKRYMAHDKNNTCHSGDVVLLEESRPYSKNKKWVLKKSYI